MKKRLFFLLCCILVCVSLLKIPLVNAETEYDEINAKCKSAYLMDYQSGEVLYAKNENARLPIASMTKLMTLLLTFENVENGNLNLDEKVIASENASGMGGSQVYLEENGEYNCSELIKAVIIASANDASVAICERLYGSEQNAVDEMNKRAKEIGMDNTLYSNCTGLTKPTQYSCAKDVAVLLKELCKHGEYFSYSKIWMDEIKHPSGNVTSLTNTNKLVRFYEGCDGGKTGFTNEAGFCLSATAKRGAMRLISVCIGGESSKDRFNAVSSMFNYGFTNYSEKCVFEKGEEIDKLVSVKGGEKEKIELVCEKDCYIFGKKNEKIDYSLSFDIQNKVKAPVKMGQPLGKVKVFVKNICVCETNLVAKEQVQAKNYIDEIIQIANDWK